MYHYSLTLSIKAFSVTMVTRSKADCDVAYSTGPLNTKRTGTIPSSDAVFHCSSKTTLLVNLNQEQQAYLYDSYEFDRFITNNRSLIILVFRNVNEFQLLVYLCSVAVSLSVNESTLHVILFSYHLATKMKQKHGMVLQSCLMNI